MWRDDMIEQAKNIVKTGQMIRPVFLLKKPNQMIVADMSPFLGDKDFMTFMLKFIVAKENPDEYLLIVESLIKVTDPTSPEDVALNRLVVNGALRVGQLPSAQDCITLVYGDRTSEKMGTIIFKRTGNQVDFQNVEWYSGERMQGRFIGLRRKE